MLQPVEMAATKPATLSGAGLRRVLVVLCVTEITSWGVLYYAFPVLAPSIAADTGWSVSTITAAFSTGLVVSAAVGIPAGGWLDRCGPGPALAGVLGGYPAVFRLLALIAVVSAVVAAGSVPRSR